MAVDLKLIAKRELDVFGGEPHVVRYERDAGSYWVDVLSCADQPTEGVTSWGTIGTALFDTQLSYEGKPVRFELVGACASNVESFGQILSTCAFNFCTGQYRLKPGLIYPDVVAMYLPDSTMKHAMFTTPFLWSAEFEGLDTGLELVDWLQLVPVADIELEFVREHSAEALEDLFEQTQIDVFDMNRSSVV